jgi:hypothetical protein
MYVAGVAALRLSLPPVVTAGVVGLLGLGQGLVYSITGAHCQWHHWDGAPPAAAVGLVPVGWWLHAALAPGCLALVLRWGCSPGQAEGVPPRLVPAVLRAHGALQGLPRLAFIPAVAGGSAVLSVLGGGVALPLLVGEHPMQPGLASLLLALGILALLSGDLPQARPRPPRSPAVGGADAALHRCSGGALALLPLPLLLLLFGDPALLLPGRGGEARPLQDQGLFAGRLSGALLVTLGALGTWWGQHRCLGRPEGVRGAPQTGAPPAPPGEPRAEGEGGSKARRGAGARARAAGGLYAVVLGGRLAQVSHICLYMDI